MNAAHSNGLKASGTPPSIAGRPEDRRYPRFDQDLPAIKINDLGAHWQGYFAEAVNVSERGFCIRIPFPLAMGNSFNFEISLPDKRRVSGTSQCRWTHQAKNWLSWACGSEIIGLNPAEARDWEDYIRGLNRTVSADAPHGQRSPSS